jgi:hypothetical protein
MLKLFIQALGLTSPWAVTLVDFFGRTEPYRFRDELRGPSAHLSELR